MLQLKPKREIPGDGNCQMHAVSDQLYDTIERSKEVRKIVVEWLRKNKNWKLVPPQPFFFPLIRIPL
jgi:hypothetical protein